ncbi:Phosphatidylinositol transfer protein alpha isoform [Orchesella cincta]|uniref:Phosphatidylinositol transfer protein alpha isoform n=1 Tax=Orchesella cincta TaxID=48709 RepID=A0A1D2MU37_ORCCI|nr:Phosphatidylinositol transfer protein alpha isoform [Orchesella cincta]
MILRIPMPMTLEEYQIGQGYTTVETAKLETGGGDGVEEVMNEPFRDHDLGCFGIQSGHYSMKRYHLDHKVPTFVRIVTPRDCLQLQEECWNAFPYFRTVLTNDYLHERLVITIETVHLSDKGCTENALGLSPEKLSQRDVVYIDIAKDYGAEEAFMPDTRITGITSAKTRRGPFQPNWFNNYTPVMTCYKLVTCEVKIFGLQSRLETFIIENQRKLFTAFHRRVFIFMDKWYGLTVTDIRRLENEAAEQLEQLRRFGEFRGTRVGADEVVKLLLRLVLLLTIMPLVKILVEGRLKFCLHGRQGILPGSEECPGGVFFKRPVMLQALSSEETFCVKNTVCDDIWECGTHRQSVMLKLNIIKLTVQQAQVVATGMLSSNNDSWGILAPKDSINENIPACTGRNSWSDNSLISEDIKHRIKRQVNGLVPAERTTTEEIQREVDDQTKRMFYYLTGINQEQVNSHLRVVKLFKMSVQLASMICDPIFLKPKFLQEIEKGFLFLLKEQGFDKVIDVDLESYNQLKKSMEHCTTNIKMVKFLGESCPTQTNFESVYRYSDNGKMRDQSYEPNEKTFKWGEYDIVIDAAWSVVDIVHGGCFESFSKNLNLHHKFQVALEQLFHAALYLRWENPTKLADNSFYDSIFMTKVNDTMKVMDGCARYLYLYTPYKIQLTRPIHETFYRRKKRSLEEGDNAVVNEYSSSQEDFSEPWEKTVGETVENPNAVELAYCLNSEAELENAINTAKGIYCEPWSIRKTSRFAFIVQIVSSILTLKTQATQKKLFHFNLADPHLKPSEIAYVVAKIANAGVLKANRPLVVKRKSVVEEQLKLHLVALAVVQIVSARMEPAFLAVQTKHVVLEKIFSFCKTNSLLQCRLVSRMWAEEATRILRKKGVAIAFRANEDIEEFLTIPRPLSQMFTNFLIDIPSNTQTYGDCTRVADISVQIFDLLECYKDDVNELKIWYQPQIQSLEQEESDNEPNADLEDENDGAITILNLTTLHLLSNYVQPSNLDQQQNPHQMPKFFAKLSTPNLQYLAIQHLYDTDCSSTVIRIIKSSLNDLEYFKIPSKLFPSITSGNAATFANLCELDLLGIFHGFSCATNETLESIKKSCPNLKKLGIEFSFRATLNKIQELLETLANTLVELRCTIQDRNLLARQILRVDFRFPEMKQLTSLQMRWSNPGLVYYIDRLPVLKELMLDTVWTRKIQGNIYPSGQPFEKVDYTNLQSLKLTQMVSAEQIEMFSKYFPNLQTLGCSFESNEALRTVYKRMLGLKWLIIERKSNITEGGGVCGMEDEELTKISDNAQSKGFEVILRAEAGLPHIGNLKDLETLELCQLGITWCSLLCGVVHLPKLRTLVAPSKAFRVNSDSQVSSTSADDMTSLGKCLSLSTIVASRLTQLRNLTLWIRHTSEKLSTEEIETIQQGIPLLDELSVMNHSLCGI